MGSCRQLHRQRLLFKPLESNLTLHVFQEVFWGSANQQTHETALYHGHQPVDSKGGTGQDAEGVSRTQMALISLGPCSRPQSHPYWGQKLFSLAPKWWLRCEEMRLMLEGYGSPCIGSPIFHGHSFSCPYDVMPVTRVTALWDTQRYGFQSVFTVVPVWIQFTIRAMLSFFYQVSREAEQQS